MGEVRAIDRIYYRPKDGYFWRKSIPGDPVHLLVTREARSGPNYDEMRFSALTGYIQDIYITSREKGGNLLFFVNIDLKDQNGDQIRTLQLFIPSSECQGILDRWPNIKIDRPVEIKCGYNKDNNRTFTWVAQDGETVTKYFTAENPEDKPSWEQTSNGWNSSKQEKWYRDKIVEWRSKVKLMAVSG